MNINKLPLKIVGASLTGDDILFKVNFGQQDESFVLSRVLQQYHPHVILNFYEQFLIIDGKESDCIPPQDWMKEFDKSKYEDLLIKNVDG